jgi:hypothetical protein
MRTSSSSLLAVVLLSATGCGARTLPLTGGEGGVGSTNPEDASTDGGSEDAAADRGGPPPVPVCSAKAQCVPPGDAGLSYTGGGWTGGAVILCQPEPYAGPWTLLLERLVGTTYQLVQRQVVQEPGFGASFYDRSGSTTPHTYRVCLVENDTATCGSSFLSAATPYCPCEPTSCYLQVACNTTIDDQCGGTLNCGACSNGASCNPENGTCCATGFMGDGWGNCVCAPPPAGCLFGGYWNTTDCLCESQ